MFSGDGVTVALVQLTSPFNDEITPIRGHDYPVFGWTKNAYEKKLVKIRRILDRYLRSERHIDILVFPEYALHPDMVPLFKEFSENNNTICIVNYYMDDERANISKIIFPSKAINGIREYNQYKISPSEEDADYLLDLRGVKGDDERLVYYRFNWFLEVDGKENRHYFQVFNCIDYISSAVDNIEYDFPGLIFVSACSSNINQFYQTGEIILRRSIGGLQKKSIVTCFCNNSHKYGSEDSAYGGTAMIASQGHHLSEYLGHDVEGVVVADINCSAYKIKPTPTKGENSAIRSAVLHEMADDGADFVVKRDISRNPVINPVFLAKLGLSCYYFLYRTKNYVRLKKAINNMNVGCAAIFGYHDILVKSYDEDSKYIEARISKFMNSENLGYSAINHDIIKVNKHLKFRGEEMDRLELDSSVTPNYIKKELAHIRAILSGCAIDLKKYDEYCKYKIFLPEVSHSDLLVTDRESKKSEYHIYYARYE